MKHFSLLQHGVEQHGVEQHDQLAQKNIENMFRMSSPELCPRRTSAAAVTDLDSLCWLTSWFEIGSGGRLFSGLKVIHYDRFNSRFGIGMGNEIEMNLNDRCFRYVEDVVLHNSADWRIQWESILDAKIIDFGVACQGGLEAGLALAKICTSTLTHCSISQTNYGALSLPVVEVRTDHPLQSCMQSQYAGWPVKTDGFFSMGSGPLRSIRGKEKLLETYGLLEEGTRGVLCLESGKKPSEAVVSWIADEAGIATDRLIVAVAPTASLAGSFQVVARSVETALHKIHELGFDLRKVVCGFGRAPLPPIANDDLRGIGRTNDSILFGGEVTLWVDCEDDQILELGEQVPSSASSDFGTPFFDLFSSVKFDFYKIDPHLFAPARVHFCNIGSGKLFTFGDLHESLLRKSFGC